MTGNVSDLSYVVKLLQINQKLESIKKTFQEYNLDLKRINEVIEDVANLEQSNKELLDTVVEAQKVIKNILEGMK